jgi:hypothetical protein
MQRAISGGGKFGYLPGCGVKAYVHTGEGGLSSGDGKIQEIATAVQRDVKAAVQAMTGKPVTRVNVNIAGVVLEEKAAQ